MDITIHVDVATAAVLLSHHNKPIITIGATIENVPTASCTSDGEKSSLGWRVHQMSTVFRTLRWRFSVVDWRASDDGMTFKTSIYLMNDFPSSCNGHANTHGFVCHPGKSVEMIPPNYVHVQSNASVVTPWWFPCVVVVLEMCNLRSLLFPLNGDNVKLSLKLSRSLLPLHGLRNSEENSAISPFWIMSIHSVQVPLPSYLHHGWRNFWKFTF